LSSPYKFHKLEKEGYYSFVSKNDITYNCFFTQKVESSSDLLGLKLNSPVIFFNFNRENKESAVIYDRRIGFTIADILNQFFKKNPSAIISYICENGDYKAIKRQNHFEKWFSSTHNDSPKKTIVKAEIHDVIYAGAIMLVEHPEKKKVEKYFTKEIKKFNESDKSGEINIFE